MATIRVQIKNLKQLQQRLNQYPFISGKHLSQAINDTILEIEAKAKPITPVKKGRLVGSYAFGRIKSTPRTLKGRVKPNVSYAPFVHNLYPPGQPYRRPSLNKRALAGFVTVGAKRAQRNIDKIFQRAADRITNEIGD